MKKLIALLIVLVPFSMSAQTVPFLTVENQNVFGHMVGTENTVVLNNSTTGTAAEYLTASENFEELPVFGYDKVFKKGNFTYGIDVLAGYLDVYNQDYQLIDSHPIDVNGMIPSVVSAKNLGGSIFIVSRGVGDTKSYLLQNNNLLTNTTTPADGQAGVRGTLIYNGELGGPTSTVLFILKTNELIVRNYSQNGVSYSKDKGAGCLSFMGDYAYMNYNGSYVKMNILTGSLQTIFHERTVITTLSFENLIIGKGLVQIGEHFYGGFIIYPDGEVVGTNQFGIDGDFNWMPTNDASGASTTVVQIPGTQDYLVQFGKLNSTDLNTDENFTAKVTVSYDNDQVVAINDAEEIQAKIKTFPNPTTDFITIDIENEVRTLSAIFYTNDGKEVLRSEEFNSNTVLSLNTLPSGTYILKIVTANEGSDLLSSRQIVKI